jgi:TonB family protein
VFRPRSDRRPVPDPVYPYLVEESPSRLRLAVAAAAALHALLLLIPTMASQAEVPEPEKKQYRVVPTQRFKPPEPPPVDLREERVRIVPIPDPDPTDPEPIRPIEVLPPVYDLPPLDPVIDFPEAPPPDEPEQVGPYVIGGPVSAPVRVEAPMPRYPEVARRARIECIVLLRSVIDEAGRVTSIAVDKPCPFGMTEAATEAVERWSYRPATRKGLPVQVYMNLRVEFSLN